MTEPEPAPIYTDEKFPHGLKCCDDDCDHTFTEGERYMRRLVSMTEFMGDPAFVVELVCVPCGLKGAVTP